MRTIGSSLSSMRQRIEVGQRAERGAGQQRGATMLPAGAMAAATAPPRTIWVRESMRGC
jgi:hypothetical protein